MSIKCRLEAMEREAGGADPLIVLFRTIFDGKDGSIESEVWSASIASGPYCGTYLERQGDETFDKFRARSYAVSRGGLSPDEQANNTLKQRPLSPVISMKKKGSGVESTMEKGPEK